MRLHESIGFVTSTIAKLLREDPIEPSVDKPNHLLVIDEAGMVGTRQMRRILEAAERGGAIRHVAVAERKDGKPVLTVGPRFVPASSPLCSIPASAKAVLFRTDCAGEMCITGVGSGGARTAFALLRDIVDIAMSR